MRVQAFAALGMAAGLGAMALPASAQNVTYARDVAPIIQDKCQECHTENSIAPFTLENYDQVVRRARMIRRAVDERVMPPWHINPTVGVQHFKNDRGLTPDERQTILAWIDAGTPMGDPANLPAPREPVDYTQWQMADQFGEPDLVVTSEPYTLEAVTQDKWFRPVVPTGLTEERWVRAIEIKPSFPGGRRIVHHSLAFLIQDESKATTLARPSG